jgi:hypothetical protein
MRAALLDLLSSSQRPHPLLPKPTGRLPCFSAATIAWFLEMGSSFQVSQNPVPQHQPFEKSERSLDTAIPDGHFQRAVSRRVGVVGTGCVPARPTSEGHACLLGDTPPAAMGPHRQKQITPQGLGPRGANESVKPSEPKAVGTVRGLARLVKNNPREEPLAAVAVSPYHRTLGRRITLDTLLADTIAWRPPQSLLAATTRGV